MNMFPEVPRKSLQYTIQETVSVPSRHTTLKQHRIDVYTMLFRLYVLARLFLTINSVTTGVRELNGTSQISLVTHDAKGEMREI